MSMLNLKEQNFLNKTSEQEEGTEHLPGVKPCSKLQAKLCELLRRFRQQGWKVSSEVQSLDLSARL